MFPVDSKHVAVLGGATAAFLAGVYVLWGPSEKRPSRKRKDLCPGLVNLGNTCFLNSLLQAVAPCMSVVQWLKDFLQNNQDITADSKSLAHTLSHSLEVLNNESVEYTEEYNPNNILGALRMKRWHISSDQQDAHELYHVFTETLEEEAAKYPSVLPLFDANKIDEQDECDYQADQSAQCRSRTRLPVLPGRGSDQPFRGLLASQLQCTKCGHKCSVKYDTFDSLSLSIPSPHVQGVLTLEHLLRRYVTSETVQNVECEGCAQLPRRRSSVNKLLNTEEREDLPKPKATFSKKLTIGKLPACLCVHVQRLTWLDNGMPLKRYDHIAFPETLHMDGYVYHKRPARPSSLDIDNRKGLVGGKNVQHGDCNGNKKKTPTPSPTVTSPYSGPVNLLKALNYTSRTTMNGLFMQPPAVPAPISRQSPVPSRANSQVQRLTRAYSMEMAGVANNDNAYKLTSVIVHLGDVDSGHFITYRRAVSDNGQRFPDRWLYTSDTEVRKVSLATVLQADAYMLFYERV